MLIPSEIVGDRPVTLINAGFLADADGPALSGPVPSLGGNTEAVLAEAGYSADEIAALRRDGVI
jgi:CoA:oxalate CoA-transferase